jgi:uncharacterized protein
MTMPAIDADAHVVETERTWEFMNEAEAQFQPRTVALADDQVGDGRRREFWMVDGHVFARRVNIGLNTSLESREMLDVEARLKHMDELQVDVQVLFPTLLLRAVTDRAEAEVAICRSYNRWLAEIWKLGKGRLRWAAALPLYDMDKSLEELHFCKDRGACAVFVRYIEADRQLTEPYFDPLYQEAASLNMPICIHAGAASLAAQQVNARASAFVINKLGPIGAFHSLATSEIPDRFPDLRFGFIELCSQWVPYALHDLRSRARGNVAWWKDRLLSEKRFFVACQTDDDLPYVLQYTGPNNLVLGTDYGHNDTASELDALRHLKREGQVDPQTIERILWDNAKALYGL